MSKTNFQKKTCRIVLTGGPGGGKTTAVDLFRREIGDRVVVVPEVATILYGGGFPRSKESGVKEAAQKAIYHVQINIEAAQAATYKNRILLCDRGTLDGSAYWPGSLDGFFAQMNTTLEQELNRYDAVLFFETASVGGVFIEGGNPIRIESTSEAIELDHKLKSIWSQHNKFIFIPHKMSFIDKMNIGLQELTKLVGQFESEYNV